ncbi:MAG: cell division protein SepF [Lachnospiraceae bacterium]|nr:cell division protein SepF [Lachnospiraceae bacterium]
MGLSDKFMNFLRLTEDDEEYDDDLEMDEDDYIPPKKKAKEVAPRRRTAEIQEIKPEKAEVPASKPVQRQRPQQKVIPMRKKNAGDMEVCVIKPTSIGDEVEITDTLLTGRAVIINIEGIPFDVAQRIIDFASGSCYAMNGNLRKVSKYIFIITPPTVDISGDFQEFFDDDVNMTSI